MIRWTAIAVALVCAAAPAANGQEAPLRLTLEEAIRKMTSLPAQHFGLSGRGALREGAAADLVIFDATRVRDTATYERPHAFPDGIPHVLVNGAFVVRDGKATGARPGQVLRRERK